MNKKLVFSIVLFSFFLSENMAGQTANQAVEVKNFTFPCNDTQEVISLPSYFSGPTVLPYEGGYIINFVSEDAMNTPDSLSNYCIVSILCGKNASLSLDKSYLPIKTENEKGVFYYSEKLDKYARRSYFEKYLIIYEQASAEKKKILDEIIDSLKETENK